MTDRVTYLLRAAETDPGRDYKSRLLAQLDLRPGLTVLDLGCGPGTDLAAMAATGADVIGVDTDPEMVAAAREHVPAATVVEAAGESLPFSDSSIDRVRVDRVLMHVADPATVLAECRRVLRPDGLLALAEPDWDTLVFDAEDLATTRAYRAHVVDRVVRNAVIGRQLARLAGQAGFRVLDSAATPVTFTEYAAADTILRMEFVARRAVEEGTMAGIRTWAWLDGLKSAPFHAGFTLHTVLAAA